MTAALGQGVCLIWEPLDESIFDDFIRLELARIDDLQELVPNFQIGAQAVEAH